MAQIIADRNDIEFVLYEQMEVEKLFKSKKFKSLNRKMSEMIITEVRNFALKEILPTYEESDRNGATFENGMVKVPECFKEAHKKYVENEWVALTQNPEYGGQGLPHMIAQVAWEYFMGSNYSFAMLGVLAGGAGKLIEMGGTPDIKDLILENVYTGKWGATMLLTEPNAGSDVGSLITTATRNDDGTYSLKGNKIFISYGEHDLTENIIHPVLARIEGAPAGTKGISLFLVPKYRVNPNGTLGQFNNIVCTGIEEKMGLHGSPTCSMNLGEKGECRGYLLGEENKGMNLMFYMMNDVRLEVGMQALGHASAAYLYAVAYARERLQGRAPGERDLASPQVTIIQHPDVRRMLLEMKSYIDGMRSFVYYISKCFDTLAVSEDSDECAYHQGLIDFLTPVLKAYNSQKGFDVCVLAMQIYGGYGYTREYPIEQILRDSKICSIYEGTDGIQAMDLLGRKLGMGKGVVFQNFTAAIEVVISDAEKIPELTPLANKLSHCIELYSETAEVIYKLSLSDDFKTGYAYAFPFLIVTGDIVMAWMLLWRATVAVSKLNKICAGKEDKARKETIAAYKKGDFYEGQLKTAEYFIQAVLPVTVGRMAGINTENDAIVNISEKAFSS